MDETNVIQKLFQQLPQHPELISEETVEMLPADAWAWFMINIARNDLQAPDPNNLWQADDLKKFISLFKRWAEIPRKVWNELLMWYPEFEKYCPAEVLEEIKFVEATGHPSSFYEDFEEEDYKEE